RKLFAGRTGIADLARCQAHTVMQIRIDRGNTKRVPTNSELLITAVKLSGERENEIVCGRIFRQQLESALRFVHCAVQLSLLRETDCQLQMTIAVGRIQLKAVLGLHNSL